MTFRLSTDSRHNAIVPSMSMRCAMALFPLVLSLAGCVQPENADLSATELPAPKGNVFPCTNQEREYVARNESEWVEVWNACHAPLMGKVLVASNASAMENQTSVPPRPEIDFNRSMVVGYSWGMRPSTGYEVVIKGVEWNGSANVVEVQRVTPGPDCIVGAMPFPAGQLAVVPRREGAIVFHLKDVEFSCEQGRVVESE